MATVEQPLVLRDLRAAGPHRHQVGQPEPAWRLPVAHDVPGRVLHPDGLARPGELRPRRRARERLDDQRVRDLERGARHPGLRSEPLGARDGQPVALGQGESLFSGLDLCLERIFL